MSSFGSECFQNLMTTGSSMEAATPKWTSENFRQRLTVLSHAAIIMTLVTIWLIQLVDVLQPLFIALGKTVSHSVEAQP